MTFLRVAVAAIGCVLALGLAQARSCGYEEVPRKGEGEPCTRTDECEDGLECRGGVCMPFELPDAGPRFDAGRDAGSPFDAGDVLDAGEDAGELDEDAAIDASFDAGA